MLKRRNLSMAAALRAVVACIVLVGVTAFVTSKVVSDDKPGDKHGGQPEMDPAMAKMIEMGTPGPEHVQALARPPERRRSRPRPRAPSARIR